MDERVQFLRRLCREILPVHPLELRRIEDRGLLENAFERKELAQLLFAQDLAIAPRTPTKKRKEIAHRLWENSQVLVVSDGGRPVSF